MSEAEQSAEILEALESVGLAELYVDEEGHEVMRLTAEGAAMAEQLGILEHGSSTEVPEVPEVPEATPKAPEPESLPPLEFPGTFGTAVGAAMLGFEQALRSEPPPEIQAAEHVAERGLSGDDDDVVIEFPEDVPRRER